MPSARRVGPVIVSFLVAFAAAGAAIAEHSPTALLPDLAMLQPTDFQLARSGDVRLLRFSTSIVNLGPGRFDVFGSDPDPLNSTRLTRVTQRLQQDGGWVTHPTAATMFYSGDDHNHWHVYGLQDWKLAFQATPNDTLAATAKIGFCFWDNVNLSNAPKYYDGSRECHQQLDGTVPMGLSVGWGDEYPWFVAFQYIDVSGMPNGNYCLTLTADPRSEFVEASTANNSVRTLIAIQSDAVTVLAPDCEEGSVPDAPLVHVADLDGTAKGKGKSGRWEAVVKVTVRDDAAAPVAGATVSGQWSGAVSGSVSGVTASNGSVSLRTGSFVGAQVTFMVTNVAAAGSTYDPAANNDSDGDSTGTAITISRP